MRFGGLIAATAWFVFNTGGAPAQTADPVSKQPASAQTGSAQTGSPQEGTQQQIHNPQSEADAAQQRQQQLNPADKSAPTSGRDRTAEEQYQERVRQYDPLANQAAQPQSEQAPPVPAAPSRGPSHGAEPAAMALPGPVVGAGADSGSLVEYTGPAVLSRSYTLLRPGVPAQQRWLPVAGGNAVYDSGLYGLEVNSQGVPTTRGAEGGDAFWGLSGRRYFHRDVLGINYRGDVQLYSNAKEYNGSNHFLTFDYTHAFSRKLSATLVESGSIYSQNYSLENPVAISQESIAAVNLSTTPNIQVFDNGLKQFTTSLDVTYLRTARLSFDGGASWFAIERNAKYLLGATGGEGRVDALYRLTRRTTLGLAYSYNRYRFEKGTGQSQFDTLELIYSRAFSSSLQLRARAGGSRLNANGLTSVAVSPDIAALLGVGSVIVEYRNVSWVSNYSAQLVKDFRRGRSASLAFARGLTPGNGLYLTSINQTVTGNGSFLLFRKYYASLGGGYDSLKAATESLGTYKSGFVFAGLSRSLPHGFQSNLRFDYRHFIISGAPLLRNEYRVSAGLSWSPVEGLFRLW